jgi:2-polyprenyl-3-methyl-5-hydroxy-6-metoxy-1,4-benzoquinol methylase
VTGTADALDAEAAARALSLRMFRAMLATQESFTAYLGYKLGLYEVLRDHGPLTAAELATRAGIAPRYAREWLEQQASSGLVAVDAPGSAWQVRRYRLPPGHDRVLTASADPLSLVSTALLPLGGVARALPHLLAAYRTGAGLDADVFGDDWRDGHGGANRAIYTHQLAGWLRLYLPDTHERLGAPGARAADVGCGAGWASIALAAAYPHLTVTAVDVDAEVVAQAREHIAEAGFAARVTCVAADVSTMDASHGYDVVCVFDALHELARPVEALRVCRKLCRPGGTVLVLDAKVADDFAAPGDEVERFQYATSVLHCLPAALVGDGAVGTGTVMRGATVREFAREAGFADVRAFDLGDRFHRIYRLDT